MTKKRRCFVIMPFSKTTDEHTEEYWTKHFTDFLKPLIEQSGELEAYRSEALRGDILKGIITSLVIDPIVVADLTDHNSNVYWELGIRQSFKHGTITVREEGTKIPFDIGTKGTLTYYPGDHIRNAKFARDFQAALSDCLENPDRPDSHVLETLSGRGTFFGIIRHEEVLGRLKALVSECDWNLALNDGVKKTVDSEEDIPTDRFRSSAAELLVINRYLDLDDSFYRHAEKYLNQVYRLNAQIREYRYDSGVKNWFKQYFDSIKSKITDFKKRISDIYKELLLE